MNQEQQKENYDHLLDEIEENNFDVKACPECGIAWEKYWKAENSEFAYAYYSDFPTFGLERRKCGRCGDE